MREQFRAHYPVSDEQLSDLWKNATIVFDTNALLNLFRYPSETRDDFLDLLDEVQDRLWIPHQVGAEFHRRRLDITIQQNQALQDFDSAVNKSRQQIKSSLNGFQRHMPAKSRELKKLIDSQLKTLKDDVKGKFEDYKNDVLANDAHDETFQKITELYDGRVGEPYGPKRLMEIHSEGEQRYRLQIPPGYEDAGKNSNKFGDLIVWYQILDYAEQTKRPVFFVTDDETEDWWTIVNTRPASARQELVDEFLDHSNGQAIQFYLPATFLKAAQKHGIGVKEETVEEVTTYADERRQAIQRRDYQGSIRAPLAGSYLENLWQGVGSSVALQNALDNISSSHNYVNQSIIETLTQSGLQSALRNAQSNTSRGIIDTLATLRNAGIGTPQVDNSDDEEFSEWDSDAMADDGGDNLSNDDSSSD